MTEDEEIDAELARLGLHRGKKYGARNPWEPPERRSTTTTDDATALRDVRLKIDALVADMRRRQIPAQARALALDKTTAACDAAIVACERLLNSRA